MADVGNFIRMLVRPSVTVALVAALIYMAVDGGGEAKAAVIALGGVAVNAWFSDRANGPAELGDK